MVMAEYHMLTDLALQRGATRAAMVDVELIQFSESFRELCEMNNCGKYNTNWMCPPAVGPFEELRRKVLGFRKGLVVQTVYQMEDSFDFEGMMTAADIHERVFRDIIAYIRSTGIVDPFFPLNAGVCRYCEECTYPDSDCLFPDEALASVEAYGIDVTALVTACGIPYNNGQASVSYVGLILMEPVQEN
jgi:predicted metal-binding protein